MSWWMIFTKNNQIGGLIMEIRKSLCALMIFLCVASMFAVDVSASGYYDRLNPGYSLDPGTVGIPSGDYQYVKNYTYPDGKYGYRKCPDNPTEVAFAQLVEGDFCLATSIALGGVGDLYNGKRILTLMVSVFYSYQGDRQDQYLRGAINNFRLKAMKLENYKKAYAVTISNDLPDDQSWYPCGFRDNSDLNQVAEILYNGVGNVVSTASSVIPYGKIAGKSISYFIKWVKNKMATSENPTLETKWDGTEAELDMRNEYYPFTYDVDDDSSTPSTHAYDFVGSFMIKIEYDTNKIKLGDIITIGFKFIMNVGRIKSYSQSVTMDIESPLVAFKIKMG